MGASEDTIAAVATARGRAALAVIRISGPRAVETVDACFSRDISEAPSHTVHVGYVASEDSGEIDQVVVTLFRAPRSVTGEDVVEITCHGGDFASQLIMARLVAAGARMAEPGEFTQRAFLNGKMDLTQAEAVADLIHAASTRAHRVSVSHLKGRYSAVLKELRDELLQIAALVELELDFSEEDVEFADKDHLQALLDQSRDLLERLLDSYQLGEKLRDGVRVVIGGRPNAGKSTLLNALVGHDRAIVSEAPGTTRDQIEAEAEIEGLRFRFIDTAGLRDTTDAIEAEGVRRAESAISESDVLLYVYDVTMDLDREEGAFLKRLRRAQPDLPVIIVGNKADLLSTRDDCDGLLVSAERGLHEADEVAPLIRVLLDEVSGGLSDPDASHVVTNQRHRAHLRRAADALGSAREALDAGASGDALALDLRIALHELGSITGEITNEDVLDQIFSRFCIGK